MRRRALMLCVGVGFLVSGAMSKSGAGNPEKGKALFGQQCIACHAATSTEKKIGPGLKGLFKKEKLTNGKKATEQNIRAQVDNGGNGMPAYKDMLSDPERNDLIEYLRTL